MQYVGAASGVFGNLMHVYCAEKTLPSSHDAFMRPWIAYVECHSTYDAAFLDNLVKKGAVYFCFVGDAAEQAKTYIDNTYTQQAKAVVHEKQEDALWFSVTCIVDAVKPFDHVVIFSEDITRFASYQELVKKLHDGWMPE